MRLRIGERECARLGSDMADQALTHPQPGLVDGFGIEAFGREEFEHVAGAADVDRAHLGDHVGGNDQHDLVETGLRGPGRGHDVAQPPEQAARSRDGRRRRAHVPSARVRR